LPIPEGADLAPEAVTEDSLEADLSRLYDEQTESTADAADPSASASAGVSQPSSSPEGAGADAARARDAAGRFTKAEKEAQAAAAKALETQGQPQGAELKIPQKWPAEVQQRLKAIHAVNPEHAQFVLEQYNHFRQEAAQHANRATQQLKAFDDLLAPGRQARALKNVDDATHVRQLIAAGEFLDKNPAEGIKHLMKTYGLSMEQLAGHVQAEPEVPAYVQQLAAEQRAIKEALQQQMVGAQQAQLTQASDWIQTFASQTDAGGKPLYPHFDEVLDEIVTVVQHQVDRGQQVDVKAAYDRAVRMNDAVWLKEQAARSEASKKDAQAQRLREIEEAKRATRTVSGSGAGTRTAVPENLEDHLSRLYDEQVRS
jgi:hypothetical protein